MADKSLELSSSTELTKGFDVDNGDSSNSPRRSVSSRNSAFPPKLPPKPSHLHSVSSRVQPLPMSQASSSFVCRAVGSRTTQGVSQKSKIQGESTPTKENCSQDGEADSSEFLIKKTYQESSSAKENQVDTFTENFNPNLSVLPQFQSRTPTSTFRPHAYKDKIVDFEASEAFAKFSPGYCSRERLIFQDSPASTIKPRSSRNKIASVRAIYSLMQQYDNPDPHPPTLGHSPVLGLRSRRGSQGIFTSLDHTSASQSLPPQKDDSNQHLPRSKAEDTFRKLSVEIGPLCRDEANSGDILHRQLSEVISDEHGETSSLDLIDPRLLPALRLSTLTYLSTPQLAVALHGFAPEPPLNRAKTASPEDADHREQTSQVGFCEGDVLEICVEDVGGGWSLGKNLGARSGLYGTSNVSQVAEKEVVPPGDIGLVPIGWYEMIARNNTEGNRPILNKTYLQSDDPKSPDGMSDSYTENRADLKPPESRASDLSDSRQSSIPINSSENPSKVVPTEHLTARTQIPPETLATPKKTRRESSKYPVHESPVNKLCSPTANPSVSVTNNINATFIPYGMSSIAVSVTASDAIIAARAKALPEIPRTSISKNQKLAPRGGNLGWVSIFGSGRKESSSVQAYIFDEPYQESANELNQAIERDGAEYERYEIGFGPTWKSTGPLFSVKVHSPKTRKENSSAKYHTVYTITSSFIDQDRSESDMSTPVLEITVDRRYSHFEKLSLVLYEKYGEVLVLPRLPEKQYSGRFTPRFIELRRSGLDRYLVRLIRNPVLRYSHFVTTFLGCEDEEEFEKQTLGWKDLIKAPPEVISIERPHLSSPTSPAVQFFSNVFHPDYNVDPIDTQCAIGAFNKHIRSLETGRGIINVEQSFSKVRASMQDLSSNLQEMSQEVARLTAGLALPPRKLELRDNLTPNNDPDGDEEDDGNFVVEGRNFGDHEPETESNESQPIPISEESLKTLRRKAQTARLQNSEGAMCWRRTCKDCLRMTKALQFMGETVDDLAKFYSVDGVDGLAPVEALLKEISFPQRDQHTLSKLGASVVHESETVETTDAHDEIEERRDTVLNVIMSEIERFHEERHQDVRELSEKFVDTQLQLHRKAYERLTQFKKRLSEPEYDNLSKTGPRPPNSEERQLLSETAKKQTPNTMLEWVQSTVTRPRTGSVSSTSTARSTALSTIFTQPVSAAVSSVLSLKDFFAGSGP
ncbi:hypothetical protein CROQUDRAFT_74780 [Cronartium quercuum f. sp. fusiforme G11]|uniref:PX domain-containing protein n=1 Tax=Cronartium quercuum f. sp. fusiforme G11 TaxID=708437 RepID=A0A9P6TEH3_9BASI|nr:hypothetical protein CROQUDRAFT_74780 [Cronartium quercuum f. sp. fusiforme G11]